MGTLSWIIGYAVLLLLFIFNIQRGGKLNLRAAIVMFSLDGILFSSILIASSLAILTLRCISQADKMSIYTKLLQRQLLTTLIVQVRGISDGMLMYFPDGSSRSLRISALSRHSHLSLLRHSRFRSEHCLYCSQLGISHLGRLCGHYLRERLSIGAHSSIQIDD